MNISVILSHNSVTYIECPVVPINLLGGIPEKQLITASEQQKSLYFLPDSFNSELKESGKK